MNEYTVKFNGDQTEWYLNGKLHRENGPAKLSENGHKEWWLNGKRHREDGPAFEYYDGYKEWWLNGKKYTEEEFKLQKIDKKESIKVVRDIFESVSVPNFYVSSPNIYDTAKNAQGKYHDDKLEDHWNTFQKGWYAAIDHLKSDLIAAAPELLEALEELCVLVEDARTGDYKIDSLTLQPARAAIAKAKGEV